MKKISLLIILLFCTSLFTPSVFAKTTDKKSSKKHSKHKSSSKKSSTKKSSSKTVEKTSSPYKNSVYFGWSSHGDEGFNSYEHFFYNSLYLGFEKRLSESISWTNTLYLNVGDNHLSKDFTMTYDTGVRFYLDWFYFEPTVGVMPANLFNSSEIFANVYLGALFGLKIPLKKAVSLNINIGGTSEYTSDTSSWGWGLIGHVGFDIKL